MSQDNDRESRAGPKKGCEGGGRIFLKEKLSWKHYLAIALTIVGIILLGINEMMHPD